MNQLVALPIAAVAVPAPAFPTLAASSPASEILALEIQFFGVAADYENALDVSEAAFDKYIESLPDKPDVLKVDRGRDFACFGSLDGKWHDEIERNDGFWPAAAIESDIRNCPCETVFYLTEGLDGSDLGDQVREERRPEPRTRARVDEIVSAYDEYVAERQRLRRWSGLQSAEESQRAIRAALEEMSRQLMKMPAKTLAEFQAKARVATWWHEGNISADHFIEIDDKCLAWIVRELGQIEAA